MRLAAALLIVMASLYLWYNASQPIALHLWGVQTKAQVYAASAISARRSSAFAKYKFAIADGTLVHGSYLGTRNAVGHSVQILYLPSNPAVNGSASFGDGATQVGFCGIIGWLLSFWAVRVALPKARASNAEDGQTTSEPLAGDAGSRQMKKKVRNGKRRPAFGLSLVLSGCLLAASLAYLRFAGDMTSAGSDTESGTVVDTAARAVVVSLGSTAPNGSLFGLEGA